jgi:HEAT repeat protein
MPRPVNCAIDPYELLITAMKDKAAPVRDAALGVYEAAIPPEVGEHYIYPALQSPNPFVRAGAADVLVNYKLHQQEAEQAICDLLKHSNVDVRLQALRGVRRENRKYSKALAEPLNHALVDENAVIRAGAARGLANLGRWAAPAKENLLALVRRPFESEGDLIAGAEAARALGHIRAKEAVPDFVNLLKINDYELRLNVVNAIGDIGLEAQSAIPELKDLLKLDYSDLRTAVRTTIAKILQKKKS